MADSGDLDGALRHAGILYGMDDASRGHKEHQHNEYRDHGPGKFYLISAVILRRLWSILRTSAELCISVREQTINNNKYYSRTTPYHYHLTTKLLDTL